MHLLPQLRFPNVFYASVPFCLLAPLGCSSDEGLHDDILVEASPEPVEPSTDEKPVEDELVEDELVDDELVDDELVDDEPVEDEHATCAFPIEEMSAVESIQDAVDRINELPKPLTIPCFIESLPQPLQVNASLSVFSAQPAAGARSPRIFLFSGPLIMSIVPEGEGSVLLELSEVVGTRDSVKAELKFPVEETLSDTAPYEGIWFTENFTQCSGCHSGEKPAEGFPLGATVSEALGPEWDENVSLDSLVEEKNLCDWSVEPYRCAMLQSLFSGPVVATDFPEEFFSIFE